MPTVLVYGFYGKGNIGDELFKSSFRCLFPEFSFDFVSKIDTTSLEGVDAVFFGGGSFMYMAPWITPQALPLLMKMPVFYIGVGVEQVIDPIHQALLAHASGVFIRSEESLELVRKFNSGAQLCHDIVFALDSLTPLRSPIPKSVLFVPNMETVPRHNAPHWAHVSWESFKNETAQALDLLLESCHSVRFLPFCKNSTQDDTWAASEIVARMIRRSPSLILPVAKEADAVQTMSGYDVIVTQRFHGIVLAKLAKRPCLALHHHDKLKNACPGAEESVSFYGTRKDEILSAIERLKGSPVASVQSSNFDALITQVVNKLIT